MQDDDDDDDDDDDSKVGEPCRPNRFQCDE